MLVSRCSAPTLAATLCLLLATGPSPADAAAAVSASARDVRDRQRPVQPFSTTARDGLTTTTPVPSMVEQSTWDPCKCGKDIAGKGLTCVCVMYYLCNPATNTVYVYGEDVLDERFGIVETCPGTLQQCCGVPPELLTGNVTAGGVDTGSAGGAGNGSGVGAGGVEVRPPLPPASTPPTPIEGVPAPQPTPDYQPQPVPPLPTDSSQGVSSGAGGDGGESPPREGTGSSPPTAPLPSPSTSEPRWECGVRRTDFALLDTWARVDDRDGEEVAFGEFPWTLVLLREDDNTWLGGASLVSPRVALTAAHTVHGMTAEELRVRAGEWDAATTDEPLAHQERRVVTLIEHPAFVRRALFHDAALLQLDAPFYPAPHIAPVCLPSPATTFDGRRCLATGWGKDDPGKGGSLRRLLRRVDLPVVPRQTCEERLRTTRLGIFFHLHESFMCAGAENGRDTCKGDGGGPLVCQSKDDPRRYEQAGIVSWGIGCADPEVPAVYTDVSKLRLWIDQQLQQLDP